MYKIVVEIHGYGDAETGCQKEASAALGKVHALVESLGATDDLLISMVPSYVTNAGFRNKPLIRLVGGRPSTKASDRLDSLVSLFTENGIDVQLMDAGVSFHEKKKAATSVN